MTNHARCGANCRQDNLFRAVFIDRVRLLSTLAALRWRTFGFIIGHLSVLITAGESPLNLYISSSSLGKNAMPGVRPSVVLKLPRTEKG